MVMDRGGLWLLSEKHPFQGNLKLGKLVPLSLGSSRGNPSGERNPDPPATPGPVTVLKAFRLVVACKCTQYVPAVTVDVLWIRSFTRCLEQKTKKEKELREVGGGWWTGGGGDGPVPRLQVLFSGQVCLPCPAHCPACFHTCPLPTALLSLPCTHPCPSSLSWPASLRYKYLSLLLFLSLSYVPQSNNPRYPFHIFSRRNTQEHRSLNTNNNQ